VRSSKPFHGFFTNGIDRSLREDHGQHGSQPLNVPKLVALEQLPGALTDKDLQRPGIVDHLYAHNNTVPNAAEDGFSQMFMSRHDGATPSDPRSHCFVSKDRVRLVDLPALSEPVVISPVLLNRSAHAAQWLAA
tara:strand:+ start:3374 stop:3775 length:402 start_codon:yes stop_codon:yes gene_type:complete